MHDSLRSSIELALKAISIPVRDKSVTVEKNVPDDLCLFIAKTADLSPELTKVVNVKHREEIEELGEGSFLNLVNLQRINDIRYLNKFFNTVNRVLPNKGVFIGCVETIELRKQRIYRKYSPLAARLFYIIDFIYKRIFPKWKPTRRFYFWLTKGNNRVLSRAETLGRLISCGFEIKGMQEIKGLLYFAAKNVQGPSYDPDPTYGPFVKLHRIGREGKPIRVYKLRTMHPYAEYLQSYVFNLNNIKEGGKFNNDFRVTKWGRFFRKVWLDEVADDLQFCKGGSEACGGEAAESPLFESLQRRTPREKAEV